MLGKKVVVLGGSGFVGRSVLNELSKQGYEASVVVRRAERHRDLLLFPNTKLVEHKELNGQVLETLFADADIVLNLFADTTAKTENLPVTELPAMAQQIKRAVEVTKVERIMMLSQLGADDTQEGNSFLNELGKADAIMLSTVNASVTVMKPGMLIGAGDETTSLFSKQLNIMGILPVANSGVTVQPLAVQDFAKAFVGCIADESAFGQKKVCVGEECLRLKDLAKLIVAIKDKKPGIVIPMCSLGAKTMAYLGRLAPIKSVSNTLVYALKDDLVSQDCFSSLYGFEPISIEQALVQYVIDPGMRCRYNFYRQEAGRDEQDLA